MRPGRRGGARSPVPARPKYELREIWNALLYLNRTGVQWQYLPHDFPHFRTVNACYNAWRDEGISSASTRT